MENKEKQTIKINEENLQKIISKTVKNALNEIISKNDLGPNGTLFNEAFNKHMQSITRHIKGISSKVNSQRQLDCCSDLLNVLKKYGFH